MKPAKPTMIGTCHCGQVGWSIAAAPASVTACNCTLCRRYGVLWAYGYLGHDIEAKGATSIYRRRDGGAINFHFCPTCGCVTHYVAVKPDADGRHWTAVNMRLTDPGAILALPIDHFDGLDTFEDLPSRGHCVSDVWA